MRSLDPCALLDDARRLRGDAPAVRCGEVEMRYADLRDLVARIAHGLDGAGAAPGDRIAALLPNCHVYLATYYAVLERGCIVVPLNLRLQRRELHGLLEHSQARVLVAATEYAERLVGRVSTVHEAEGYLVASLDPCDHRSGRTSPTERVPSASIDRAPSVPRDDPPHGARTSGPRRYREDGDAVNTPSAASDPALLYYTSGTTGDPKGVVLTRGNLAAHVAMTLEELRLDASDVWLHAAPMFHLADAWAIWTVTAAGGTHVMMPRYDAEAAWTLMDETGVTKTNLVPAMIPGLLDATERRGRPPRGLRMLLSGGAPIAPRVVARIVETLRCEYVQTYGLTETSPFLTFSLLDESLRGLPPQEQLRLRARTGRAARDVELRVVVPAGSATFRDVPADDATVGEVVVRGPTVTPGYWRNETATREAFLGGWFHTGDLGTIDARGFLNLVDRAKDVIVTGGESVYCSEVEAVLHEHQAVREAAVFGVPDDTWGETVRAAVVVSSPVRSPEENPPTHIAEDLITFCRENLASYKCPRAIDVLAELPRTGSGKIDKKALREPFWRGRSRRIN